MFKTIVGFAAALVVMAAPAMAQRSSGTPSGLIDGSAQSAIQSIARSFGKVEMTKTRDGNPLIRAESGKFKYVVFFSDCRDGRCSNIQLIADFRRPDNFGEREMNDWNKKRAFGKAFINDDGLAVISLNLLLSGGVSRANLDGQFDLWSKLLKEFDDFLYGGGRR
ncbi:MAG TPA: YbjN domain-containing protein [Hyphomicrobiaceae bacterium]|nr:YbjN domain-containing protein [Hyphomicrobiaceae bacterium]